MTERSYQIIEDLALGFHDEEVRVLKRAFEHVVANIAKERASDDATEAELCKLLIVEARRRLRLGLQLRDSRDSEVLAYMTTGAFFR